MRRGKRQGHSISHTIIPIQVFPAQVYNKLRIQMKENCMILISSAEYVGVQSCRAFKPF